MRTSVAEFTVRLSQPHPQQERIIRSTAKRRIVRAGRRGGKTRCAAIIAVQAFLAGKRVLYATPTSDQLDAFWREVKRALSQPIEAGVYYKNETFHSIEHVGTEAKIRAKTAWNADTLRGDYADMLILDEWQLMSEDTWDEVGAPMLLDNNGDCLFIYTPPSLHSSGISRARDPRHAAKMFKKAEGDETGRWAAFHFDSRENPHISPEALDDITQDMSQLAYRQEILAEDVDEAWKGLIYSKFNHLACVKPRHAIPENWLIYSGHDFGSANPAALFYAQNPLTGEVSAWHEYLPGAGRSTAQHVQEFLRITEGRIVMKSVGGSHQEDEIRQGYAAHGWHIMEPKQQRVRPRIDRVIGLHENNKEYVFDDLYNFLFEQANFSWKLDEHGQPTDDILNESKFHLMACRQYILSDFTPETVVQRRPLVTRAFSFSRR